MTEGTGLSTAPAALLEGGEHIALKDGSSVYVSRWTARKAMQVAKFLAGMADAFKGDRLEAVRSGSALEIARALVDVAEEKAIAFVDMCHTPEDRARVRVGDLDYIEFVGLIEAIARVNFKEDDRKKLMGLVRSARPSAAGPSSTPSSPPSAA
jgi:hypothetical protein